MPIRFKSLKIKLAAAFGATVALLLLALAAAVILSVRGTATQKIQSELASTAATQARIWDLSGDHLAEKAVLAARDFGFRDAAATRDGPTIRSALNNIMGRSGADLGYVVFPEGNAFEANIERMLQTPPETFQAIQERSRRSGLLEIDGLPYQAVSEPIFAPDRIGWVVFAAKLDRAYLESLEALAAIPVEATLIAGNPEPSAYPGDITQTLPLSGFTGASDWSLLLQYPKARAYEPYNGLLITLALLALFGLIMLLACCWLVADSVTRPLSALDAAVRRVASGEAPKLDVKGEDEIGRLSETFLSMADSVASREDKIREMSATDIETGLPSRRAFQNEINAYLASGKIENTFILAAGIDRLDTIRNVIGHTATNEFVALVGEALSQEPGVITHGRLSTDTIGLLVEADSRWALLAEFRPDILGATRPVRIGEEKVDVTLTIGCSELEDGGGSGSIDRAYVGLGQARDARSSIAFFDAALYGDPSGTLSLMSELMTGLKSGDVSLAYQPKFNFRTRNVDAVEALLRWNHPTRGAIPPADFVLIAEETGHIRPLTEWVLKEAKIALNVCRNEGFDLKMSINMSARLLTQRDFIEWVIGAIGNEGKNFCLEITETAVIYDPSSAIENMKRLRDAGIEISIDDYGAGLSSLSYLKQIPAQELKIDKSFITKLESKSIDTRLVKSTIDLAHGLGLRVTAEGVETEAALNMLAALGADTAQGYYILRAAKLEDLIKYLRRAKGASETLLQRSQSA